MNKRVAVTTKDKLKLITKECLSNRKNCFHGYFRVVSVCNKNRRAFSTNVTSIAGQGKAVATSFSVSHKKKMKVVVVLIAFFSASVNAFQNGGVAELTSETFDNLAVSNLAVVEFFAPW